MLVSQAQSFRQQERLAITLAWVAGFVNVVGLFACGVAVSHVSGTTSALGRDSMEASWDLAMLGCFVLACFLAGAVASGVATDHARIRGWKSIYVLPMAIEALALVLFGVLVAQHSGKEHATGALQLLLAGTACFAMGLQNATITRISGGVVRTTHVTGVLTDLGLELAHLAHRREGGPRGIEVPSGISRRERVALLASILGSFAFGAALGTLLHDRYPAWAMAAPVLFLLWIILQDTLRPIADLEPDELVARSVGIELPRSVAVFALKTGSSRRGGVHRLPNMHAWVDRLAPEVEAVVIDLSAADDVELEGAQELRGVAQRLHRSRRALVLTGVDPRRFESLRVCGVLEVMPLGSVVADLDLALAYALSHARDEDGAPGGGAPRQR